MDMRNPGLRSSSISLRKTNAFTGLRRIILNNGVQDPTFLHEYLGYSVFRDAGVPAPRVGYATMHVNGEPYGLYLVVEAITQDFLGRWFENTKGNLYEGPGDVTNWRELELDSNRAKEDRRRPTKASQNPGNR